MSNFEITHGTGTLIATDTGGGGENYQKIKLIDATTGSITGTGIPSNPFQVSLANTGVNAIPLVTSTDIMKFGGTAVSLGQALMAASIPVVFASDQTSLPPTSDTHVTGTLSNGTDQVVIPCAGLSTVGWTTSGVWSGTMIMEVNYGDAQWFLVEVIDTNLASDGKPFVVTSWTESLNNDPWITNVAGATQARIRFTTYNSGVANIVFNGSVGINATRVYNLNANVLLTSSWLHDGAGTALTSTLVGSDQALDVNVSNPTLAVTQSGTWTVALSSGSIEIGTVDQGTPNTLANAWPVELSDGTNLLGTPTHPVRVDPTGTTTQPVNVTNATLAVTQSGVWTTGRTWTLASGTDSVAATQSGTWNITNISGTISLPTGASTSALQTTGNTSLSSIDSKTPALGQAAMAASVPVVIASNQTSIPVTLTSTTITGTVAVTQSTSPWVVSGTVTSNIGTTNGLALDTTVAALEVAQGSTTSGQKGILELGAVTTAAPTYVSGQTSPLSLDTAGNLRVVLSSASIEIGKVDQGNQGSIAQSWFTEVTDGTNVIGTAAHPFRIDPTGTTTQPISGTVTANAGTGNFTVVQTTGTNLHTVVDSGSITVANATLAVTQSGTWNINNISGTISLPTGASTSANQATTNSTLTTIATTLTLAQGSSTTGQTGNLILGATTNTSPSYTAGTSNPLSLDTSGNLRVTLSASSAEQNVNLNQVGGAAIALGQTTMSASLPVTIASNQSAIPVTLSSTTISGTVAVTQSGVWSTGRTWTLASGTDSVASVQSGTWNITNISGTVSLPTGASTAANQTTLGSQTTKINDGTNTAAVKAASTAAVATDPALVVAISPNNTVAATQSGTWNITNISGTVSLPTGASTSALQTTGNTSLSTIAGAILGQGSTTSGQTGVLELGAVTTAAPTYVTGQSSPLSLTTTGSLRSAVTANVTPADLSTTGTLGALNATVVLNVNGTGSTVFQLTGTFVATVVAEGSVDNTNWTNLTIYPASGASTTAGVTAVGSYRVPSTGGYAQIRLRASAYTSGTVNVTLNVTGVVAAPQLFSPNAINVKIDALSSKEAQSSNNQTFTTVVSAFNITPANADSVVLYLKNPSGSGKTMVIQQIQFMTATTSGATAAAIILLKMFANPTSSANGTAATISTTSVGSGVSSAVTAFTGPTVSADGTLLYVMAGGNNQYTMPQDMTAYRVAPNNNLLFTVNSGTNNTTINLLVSWSEE